MSYDAGHYDFTQILHFETISLNVGVSGLCHNHIIKTYTVVCVNCLSLRWNGWPAVGIGAELTFSKALKCLCASYPCCRLYPTLLNNKKNPLGPC